MGTPCGEEGRDSANQLTVAVIRYLYGSVDNQAIEGARFCDLEKDLLVQVVNIHIADGQRYIVVFVVAYTAFGELN